MGQSAVLKSLLTFIKALLFFPLYQKENATGKNELSVRINNVEDGTIIDIESDDTDVDIGQKLSGYLIDISKRRMAGMNNPNDYITVYEYDGSDCFNNH